MGQNNKEFWEVGEILDNLSMTSKGGKKEFKITNSYAGKTEQNTDN
jgi:hypothetical protein